MKSMISHGDRLLKSLGFIINPTRANRIYIAPIFLCLWMNEGIPVYFGSGCNEYAGFFCFCKAQTMQGSDRADFECLYRNFKIIYRTGRRCKMKDIIERTRHMYIFAHVL